MDRLDAMAVFAAVAEGGSLSAAGRTLGLPLSTVSRKIADLEAHLGTRLLTRTSRSVGLTEAGASYLQASRRILEQVAEAERVAAGEYVSPTGELTITAPVAFGRLHVLPVVAGYLAAYPDVDVRLLLSDRISNLLDEHIDLSVRIGALPDSALVATRVGAVRRVVCASPTYLDQRGRPAHPTDLAAHACIGFLGLSSGEVWEFGAADRTIQVSVRHRLAVTTAEAAIDAAVAGVGVARVLSYQAAPALAAGRLEILLGAFEPPPSPVHLLHAGGPLMPLKLRSFLDWARPRLKSSLGGLQMLETG